ncbi:MAG: YbhB/YbcL family Raf kinase inhibitor-like protein [Culicoidibacterales bacterium]
MKITSIAITNGIIDDHYGKRGEVNEFGMPVVSLPLTFHDYPEATVSFAIFLEDKDAIPVSGGFSWIHWTAANITTADLKADAARELAGIVQGVNSWISAQGGNQEKIACATYGGMAPPNADHSYDIHVYALDTILDLQPGYYANELFHAMHGHILAEALLKGTYRV